MPDASNRVCTRAHPTAEGVASQRRRADRSFVRFRTDIVWLNAHGGSHFNSTRDTPMQTPNSNGPDAAAIANDTRGGSASGLDSAAKTLRENADRIPGGEKVAGKARAAAAAVGTAADYVRDNDAKAMLGDFQRVVKNHPGAALLTAAGLGFLIARLLRRD